MYSIKVDPHTHTIASGHAFSTIQENAQQAAEKGLQAIAMTDHFGLNFQERSEMPQFGASLNMAALPKVIHGVRILAGVEIDIVDIEGNLAFQDIFFPMASENLSICDMMLHTREVAIASVHHFEGVHQASPIEMTRMYTSVAQHPHINILGHIDRVRQDFEIDEVLLAAKAHNKCIEINNHSLDSGEKNLKRCREIALRCAHFEVPIVVSSDAHSAFFIGEVTNAMTLLEDIAFPPHLIMNSDLGKMLTYFGRE